MNHNIVPEFSVMKAETILDSRIKQDSIKDLAKPEYLDVLGDINKAFEEYKQAVNENTYLQLAVSLLNATREQACVFTPFHNSERPENRGATIPGTVRTTKGNCYVICTTAEEAALCPDKFGILMTVSEILGFAVRDEDANGVCINPYGENPCLIPREYFLRLMNPIQAEEKTEGQGTSGSISIEHMKTEKKLIEDRLNYALARFYENPSEETVFRICDELVYAYVYNLNVAFPVTMAGKDMQYATYRTPGNGEAYIVYTLSDKSVDKSPQEILAFTSWRIMLSRAAKDNRYLSGLIINPYSGHKAIAYLSSVNIRAIIKNAEELINQLPEEVRDEVRKGI